MKGDNSASVTHNTTKLFIITVTVYSRQQSQSLNYYTGVTNAVADYYCLKIY